jgi:hypothetical protein
MTEKRKSRPDGSEPWFQLGHYERMEILETVASRRTTYPQIAKAYGVSTGCVRMYAYRNGVLVKGVAKADTLKRMAAILEQAAEPYNNGVRMFDIASDIGVKTSYLQSIMSRARRAGDQRFKVRPPILPEKPTEIIPPLNASPREWAKALLMERKPCGERYKPFEILTIFAKGKRIERPWHAPRLPGRRFVDPTLALPDMRG